ncbi:uncharacterized protein LOC121731623 [Aricia agestis]|uniref:uncharacterized protein LOC121731623 n=1 Tax=Aricia agestis TaxID=91739 RepID=UPI001C205C4D|nr:uncharacterized protein LOC121731623 [Aricia agestis]
MDEKGNATFSVGGTINPNEFDVSVSALLIGLGGEKYIDIFRKNNIGQSTLIELTNEDLIKLGIDDAGIRKKLLDEVKNLPVYTEIIENIPSKPNLDLKEVINVLEESSQHLYRIYLSMMTNTLALKNSKAVDCLIDDELFASKVALSSLRQMTETLNVMDIALHTQFKAASKESKHRRRKKVVVGTLGGVIIAVLGVCFVRSLKNL